VHDAINKNRVISTKYVFILFIIFSFSKSTHHPTNKKPCYLAISTTELWACGFLSFYFKGQD